MAKSASPKRARDVGSNSSSKGRKATSTGKVAGTQGSLLEDAPTNAIALLETDHRAVEKLFEQFDHVRGDAEQRDTVNAICIALKIHARLEEELFYPAAAKVLDEPSMIMEAMVEHASAKDLIAQIETGAPGQPIFEARVKVLSEYVAHHVAEEENELFSQVRDSGLDLEALGAAMAMRKQELSAGFVASNPVIGLANARADANA